MTGSVSAIDLVALRLDLSNRLAAADRSRRAELKPIALQVEAVASALETLRKAAASPAPAPTKRELNPDERAELDALETEVAAYAHEQTEIKQQIRVLERDLAALLARVDALERRQPQLVYSGGMPGARGPAGPPGKSINPADLAPADDELPESFFVFQAGEMVRATKAQMIDWLGGVDPDTPVVVNGETVTVNGEQVVIH